MKQLTSLRIRVNPMSFSSSNDKFLKIAHKFSSYSMDAQLMIAYNFSSSLIKANQIQANIALFDVYAHKRCKFSIIYVSVYQILTWLDVRLERKSLGINKIKMGIPFFAYRFHLNFYIFFSSFSFFLSPFLHP